MVVILSKGEMSFARVRIETQRSLNGRVCQVVARSAMVITLKVNIAMHSGEKAPGKQELRVARDSFLEQARRTRQFLSRRDVSRGIGIKRAAPQIEIVGGKIFRRWLLNRQHFTGRQFG